MMEIVLLFNQKVSMAKTSKLFYKTQRKKKIPLQSNCKYCSYTTGREQDEQYLRDYLKQSNLLFSWTVS